MKIVVAIDSMKGSLSSMDGGMAIKEGILRAMPDAQVTVMPLADGGEGTTEALTQGLGGRQISVTVTGPEGKPVTASYGYLEENRTAVMEMAAAAGITLLPRERLDPMKATTRGVGEMILDALDQGCETFLIGIGGSATNDGGIGMLKALGFRFLDDHEQDVGEGAQALGKICRIETKDADPRLSRCRFRIACDVVNPLCGPEGATCIFGAQKGLAECQMTVVDIEAFFSILRNICTLEQAMESNQARRNLADTAEQVPHCDGTVEDFPIPVYGEREMVISVSFQRIIKGVE